MFVGGFTSKTKAAHLQPVWMIKLQSSIAGQPIDG